MFTNVGKKLQTLATAFCIIGITASVISAIYLWAQDSYSNPTADLSFIVLICGCLASWLSSMLIYAFGQLVDDIHEMRTSACSNASLATALDESCNNTSDYTDQIKERYYQLGYEHMVALEYSMAVKFFSLIPDYKDANEKKAECKRLAE